MIGETENALDQGIKAVVEAFDADDRFSPFTPERAQYDPEYRKAVEHMDPQDFAQVMRDTIYALFQGQYLTLGMNEKTLKGIHTPTMIMPGNNDIHPRSVAQQVHRLIPNCRWAEIAPTRKRRKNTSGVCWSFWSRSSLIIRPSDSVTN